jgi:hypothetical protein
MSKHKEPANEKQSSLRAARSERARNAELSNVSANSHTSDAAAGRNSLVESLSPTPQGVTTAESLASLRGAVGDGRTDMANGSMDAEQVTKADESASEWMITDDVIRLRQWGTRAFCELPATSPPGDWTIGAAALCWLRLADPRRLVSRRHARVVHDGVKWLIIDLDSKNGLRVDGVRRTEAVLQPGLELGIGGIMLVAESARLIVLREFLERIIGWADDSVEGVDHALRSLRVASNRRTALVVCGDDDLVQIARGLHGRTLGPRRPFIVCDPRRHTTGENVRSVENYNVGMAAIQAAAGGSLCVWARRLPRDFEDVRCALQDPAARVQLILCAREPSDAGIFVGTPITVPRLATRADDLTRIIDEYAADAAATLGMQPNSFPSSDREWVLENAAYSLPEIEKATRRLLAIRETGNLNQAAARLGMARISLKKWIGRRPLPMPVSA